MDDLPTLLPAAAPSLFNHRLQRIARVTHETAKFQGLCSQISLHAFGLWPLDSFPHLSVSLCRTHILPLSPHYASPLQ